jgi:hypothetical protein
MSPSPDAAVKTERTAAQTNVDALTLILRFCDIAADARRIATAGDPQNRHCSTLRRRSATGGDVGTKAENAAAHVADREELDCAGRALNPELGGRLFDVIEPHDFVYPAGPRVFFHPHDFLLAVRPAAWRQGLRERVGDVAVRVRRRWKDLAADDGRIDDQGGPDIEKPNGDDVCHGRSLASAPLKAKHERRPNHRSLRRRTWKGWARMAISTVGLWANTASANSPTSRDPLIRIRAAVAFAWPILLSFALVPSHAAYGASFKLVEGKRYELCRTYTDNLKSFPDLSTTTSEWPLDPRLTRLKKQRWERVDVREYIDVMKTLFLWNYGPGRQVGSDTPDEIWERESKAVFEGLTTGSVWLERARFDFDNDGHIDTVFRYFHPLPLHLRASWKTKQTAGYWYIYFSDFDQTIADRFRRYSDFDRFYDSFFFEGRSYLIGWLEALFVSELNTLPMQHDLAMIDVCRFQFGP